MLGAHFADDQGAVDALGVGDARLEGRGRRHLLVAEAEVHRAQIGAKVGVGAIGPPSQRVDADGVGDLAIGLRLRGDGVPSGLAAGLLGALADREAVVAAQVVADGVGGDHAFGLGRAEHLLAQQGVHVQAALAVPGQNKGPALVVVVQVVAEGPRHVLIGEVDGVLATAFPVKERIQGGLTVARRIDAAAAVEHARLVAHHRVVGDVVGGLIGQVLVPAAAFVEGGGVDEEHIDLGFGLVVLNGLVGRNVRQVLALRQGRPVIGVGVVRGGRRLRVGEALGGLNHEGEERELQGGAKDERRNGDERDSCANDDECFFHRSYLSG